MNPIKKERTVQTQEKQVKEKIEEKKTVKMIDIDLDSDSDGDIARTHMISPHITGHHNGIFGRL